MKPEKFRQKFLKQLDAIPAFQQLLDLLPDVSFFMKDRQGRFIMNNRRSYEYCRVASERETIGKTDYDFYPKDRADLYVAGDRQVMRTGVPLVNSIAPAPEEEGSDKLIIYNKIPLRDRQGRIIGIAGIHREIEGLRATPKTHNRLTRAVQYLHAHHAEPLATRQLAAMVGISHSQFDRQFRKLFGTTLRQYLLRIRVHAACRLLSHTDKGITDIAQAVGFYDHSHFTRTFSRLMGIAPLAFRKQHQFG
ncbi:MAG TPA: AraC family transcriptional regulator [Candidatus Paceibacterota bacterium]|nr:AraC family transcriptional regulator [Candidatus Paceibacterota bacterium]